METVSGGKPLKVGRGCGCGKGTQSVNVTRQTQKPFNVYLPESCPVSCILLALLVAALKRLQEPHGSQHPLDVGLPGSSLSLTTQSL